MFTVITSLLSRGPGGGGATGPLAATSAWAPAVCGLIAEVPGFVAAVSLGKIAVPVVPSAVLTEPPPAAGPEPSSAVCWWVAAFPKVSSAVFLHVPAAPELCASADSDCFSVDFICFSADFVCLRLGFDVLAACG